MRTSSVMAQAPRTDFDAHGGPPPGRRLNDGIAAEQLHPLAYSNQTETSGASIWTVATWSESLTVVANDQPEPLRIALNADARQGGLRVFNDIIDTLLHDPVKVDFRFLREETIDIVNFGGEADVRAGGGSTGKRFDGFG